MTTSRITSLFEPLHAQLRELADQLEAGELGRFDRAMVLLHSCPIGGKHQSVAPWVLGRDASTLETVGLLELAKMELLAPT